MATSFWSGPFRGVLARNVMGLEGGSHAGSVCGRPSVSGGSPPLNREPTSQPSAPRAVSQRAGPVVLDPHAAHRVLNGLGPARARDGGAAFPIGPLRRVSGPTHGVGDGSATPMHPHAASQRHGVRCGRPSRSKRVLEQNPPTAGPDRSWAGSGGGWTKLGRTPAFRSNRACVTGSCASSRRRRGRAKYRSADQPRRG